MSSIKKILLNPVTLVCVPGIIAIHYGWFKLQQNELFVPKHQQCTEMPIVTAVKTFTGRNKKDKDELKNESSN